jgi:ferredoxin
VLGILFLAILAGQPARHAVVVPGDLPAGRTAGRGFALVGSGAAQGPRKACNNCNRCLLNCQGGDDPIGGAPWRKAECLMCMNCVGSCPHDSLNFRFFRKEKEVASPDLGRRRALTGIALPARRWFR